MPVAHRLFVFAFAAAAGLFTLSCGSLLDARVTPDTGSAVGGGNTTTGGGNATTGGGNTTTGGGNTTTGGGNTATGGGNTTTGGGNTTTGGGNTTTGGCATATVKYTGAVADLLTSKCVTCHNDFLGTYAKTKASFTNASSGSNSKNRIDNGSMPPSGQLSAADKCLLTNWVKSNYPE